MTAERLKQLILIYRSGHLTDDEWYELATALKAKDIPEVWSADMQTIFNNLPAGAFWNAEIDKEIWQGIQAAGGKEDTAMHRVHFLRTAWFRYAAVLLLLLGAGAYFFFFNSLKQPMHTVTREKQDILPGTTGAILTLADGTEVVLDSLGNGIIAKQNGAEVLLQNGRLAYDPTRKTTGEMAYNTMTTPKGRQFNVVLPDGTKVWLNAASSLRYPTAFSRSERRIEITGEAYFEVAKNKSKPFFVKINDEALIEVLGTSFNVNAYGDDGAVRTTLIEGSVKITRNGGKIVICPGQQAVTGSDFPEIRVIPARVDDVIAWKNGLFKFNEMSVEAIMLQLARWYDLELNYQGKVSKGIYATIPRNVPVSEVLHLLEQTGAVHFKLNGRKLLITP